MSEPTEFEKWWQGAAGDEHVCEFCGADWCPHAFKLMCAWNAAIESAAKLAEEPADWVATSWAKRMACRIRALAESGESGGGK